MKIWKEQNENTKKNILTCNNDDQVVHHHLFGNDYITHKNTSKWILFFLHLSIYININFIINNNDDDYKLDRNEETTATASKSYNKKKICEIKKQ